jgi:3-deoxy-D-manno-octulosonate 8-phosphate phosphatase (KDO 8-P phosphatase)
MVTVADLELARRAARIRLVLTDCDGVLTDGGVYYSERGEELKRFSLRDGMGFERLQKAGLACAIITGEEGGSVTSRAAKVCARLYLGAKDKAQRLGAILEDHRLTDPSEVAFIGDDVNDLGLVEVVAASGLTGAPRDAMPELRDRVHFASTARAGHGAFREFAEWILSFRGLPP